MRFLIRANGRSRREMQMQQHIALRHWFDTLEARLNPSYGLLDTSVWTEQGPGPNNNAQVEGLTSQSNPVSGAVEAIAPHPTDANTLLAASVNGGIWKTTNATSLTPAWTPRTDLLSSLSISAIAYSPANTSVVYAGTGSRSSFGSTGGAPIGILKSTDAGDTWSVVSVTAGMAANVVRNVVPTTLSSGNVILAGLTNSGVWRSTDAGVNWVQISGTGGLPAGSCTSIVGDSANPSRFYTYVASTGLYRSDDGGVNWVSKSAGISTVSSRADIAIHNSTGNNVVWVATCGTSLTGVYRSVNGGDAWTSLGVPSPTIHPGGQGGTHLSFVADKTNPTVAYVGGDRQNGSFPNSLGANNYSGIFFRADSAAGTIFTSVTNNGANGTSPHADSRDLQLDANGSLILGCDGGVYRLLNPNATDTTRRWQAVVGNMRNAELHGVAYDNLNNLIFSGTQDTGSPEQSAANSLTWNDRSQGDGGITGADNISAPGFSYHYTSNQNLGGFRRRKFNASGTVVEDVYPNLTGFSTGVQFVTPIIVNNVVGSRLLFGGATNLYESTNRGDSVTSISAPGSAINGMAYGGKSGGVDNPDVIYFGAGSTLRLRTTSGGAFSVLSAYTGGTIRDIALDPLDWNRAFVVDSAGGVYMTTNAGATFTVITGNLSSQITNLETVAVYSPTANVGDTEVIVAGRGGVFRCINPSNGTTAKWFEMAPNQFPNARTRKILYDATDDYLLAGTQGRGAWSIASASNVLKARLIVNGDDVANNADTIRIALDAVDPNIVYVYFNSATPTFTTYKSLITGIDVNGLGGNDTLIVDFTNGNPVPSGGIAYNGGAGTDAFNVVGTSSSDTIAVSSATITVTGAAAISATAHETIDVAGQGGGDIVNVVPSSTIAITLHGNAPATFSGGDRLNLDLTGVTTPNMTGTAVGAGTWSFGNRLSLLFDTMELMTPGVTVTGRVFQDLNNNGGDDGGTDPGMSGVTVNLDLGADSVIEMSTSSAVSTGIYSFTDLAPGTYRIRETVPSGYTQSSANPADLTFAAPLSNPGINFGNFSSTDTSPPVVAGLYFDGSTWDPLFRAATGSPNYGYPAQTGAGQLTTLPWSTINTVYLQFSENVTISTANLGVRGVNVNPYTVTLASYDNINFVAKYTIAAIVDTDWIILDLDGITGSAVVDTAGNKLAGSWTENVSIFPTSGPAATSFQYRFKVAVGDADRNGQVRNPDTNLVRANLFIDAGQAGYNIYADIDGNGLTRNADLNAVRSHLFIDPPAGPGPNRPVRGAITSRSTTTRGVSAGFLEGPVATSKRIAPTHRSAPTHRRLPVATSTDSLDLLFANYA